MNHYMHQLCQFFMPRSRSGAPTLGLLAAVFVAGAIVGCSSSQKNPMSADATPRDKESVLSRDAAMYRARQAAKITYSLWFGLDATNDDFQGRTVILFDLRDKAFEHVNHLRLDFSGGEISSLTLNGKIWTEDQIRDRYDGRRVELGTKELVQGQNRVEISYSHPYSKTGNGFYRFVDSTDGSVYVYTNLEPYYANLVFPSFDQPDLKASFEVTVEAPAEWTVVSNMMERDTAKVEGRISWQFPPSPVFSTYLFALAAGPFQTWKDESAGIPLRLLARKSMAPHVDAREWLAVTKKGLEFYGEFFGFPYPYGKYDQILVPDFNSGAMENLGAVTFREDFIFRSKPTQRELTDRADVILHEMVHHWFGNLVTMRWWNGLWLNESFATYLANLGLDRIGGYPQARQAFFAEMKRWAYREDQLATTHPIEVSVPDTAQAFANFDGITYGKGAAALKQLHFLIGDDDFKEGMHRYFSKFANKNTALVDLIQSLAQASDQSLTNWQKAWLQTAGVNGLEARWECGEGPKPGTRHITSFELRQSAEKSEGAEGNILRPHRTRVAFYDLTRSGQLVKREQALEANYAEAVNPVPAAIGAKCPDFVYPNDGDFDYAKVAIDPKSTEALRGSAQGLAALTDDLARHMVLHSLWEQVEDGKLSARDYAALVLKGLPSEKNPLILNDALTSLVRNDSGSLSAITILQGEERAKLMGDVFELARRKTLSAVGENAVVMPWFQASLRAASTEAQARSWLIPLYEGKIRVPRLPIELDRKLWVLAAITRILGPQPDRVGAYLAADRSDRAQDSLVAISVLSPDAEAKFSSLFLKPASDPAISMTRVKIAMNAFLRLDNPGRTERWSATYFDQLKRVTTEQDDVYAAAFADDLFPASCRPETAAKARDAAESSKLSPAVRKALIQAAQTEERCVRARAKL